MDRRVARTRASLQNAHMALLLERAFDAVSVDDICQRADVARSTFYAHFAGKEDLKRAGLDHLRGELLAAQRVPQAPPFAFVPVLFAHAARHRAHFRALSGGRGGDIALERIREIVTERVHQALAAVSPSLSEPLRSARVETVAGAVMGLLLWALRRDVDLTGETVDSVLGPLLAEASAVSG